jgi:hypothetical protein
VSIAPPRHPVFLADVELSDFDGGGLCCSCPGSASIGGLPPFRLLACWRVQSNVLYSEWPLGGRYETLEGTVGIRESCAGDTHYRVEFLGDGVSLIGPIDITVGGSIDVGSFDVSLLGVQRLGFNIINIVGYGDNACVAAGDLRVT